MSIIPFMRLTIALLPCVLPSPAFARNSFGHEIVAAIAWRNMTWEQAGRINCYFVPPPDKKPGRAKGYPLDELHRLLELYSRIGKPYPDANLPGVYRVPIRSWIHCIEALIDAEDLPLIEGKNWNWTPRGNGRDGEVILATVVRPQSALDRIIMGAIDKDDRVMHLNHDPLDCRRCNLVVRTPAEQTYANRKMKFLRGEPLSSQYKGVDWDRRPGHAAALRGVKVAGR